MSAFDVDGGGTEVDLGLTIAQVIVPLEGEALDSATAELVDAPESATALALRAALVPRRQGAALVPGYEPAGEAEYPRLVKPLTGPVLTLAQQPAESLFWPWLVDNSLDRVGTGFSLWWSTDHAATHADSGLFAATADEPLGPYTSVGRIYRDDVSGNQCETPTIIWDPVAGLWRIYYQMAGVAGTRSNQVTLMATAPAGKLLTPGAWTQHGVIIDTADPAIPGATVHQGYLRALRYAGGWYGWNLLGGTFGGTQQQRSADGVVWTPAGRTVYGGPLVNGISPDFDPTTWIMKHTTCTVIEWRGRPWWIGGVSGSAHGTETAPPLTIGTAPLTPTLDRITAPLRDITPAVQGWESSAMDFLGNAVRHGDRMFVPFRSNTKLGALGIAEVV